MTRGYDDTVQVRTTQADDPAQFLWRGRLYVVREVLGRWRERQAWWSRPRALAVHGVGESVAGGATGTGAIGSSAIGSSAIGSSETRAGAAGVGLADVNTDREVWRVEASAGRMAGTGVYDLCRETVDPSEPTWLLLRVSD